MKSNSHPHKKKTIPQHVISFLDEIAFFHIVKAVFINTALVITIWFLQILYPGYENLPPFIIGTLLFWLLFVAYISFKQKRLAIKWIVAAIITFPLSFLLPLVPFVVWFVFFADNLGNFSSL